jgi:ribosomal protein S4
MRFSNRYKKLVKLERFSFPQLPLRILKFQRPKWKKFQKQALVSKKALPRFVNPLVLKNSYKQWEKVQNYYKSGIQIKKKAIALFDDSITVKSIRKTVLNNHKTNRDILLSTFIKPEFRADILLSRLNFFSSSFSARQSINEKEILLNGKPFLSNVFLKKGDIISFQSYKNIETFSFNSISKNKYVKQNFYSFVEVDFYTKTLVVVKDLNDLTLDDFSLLITEYFDLKKFRDYL